MTATATLTGLSAGTWTIDPTHTEVGFVARHLMVSKVRGAFTDVSGTVSVGDELSDSRAEVVIRTESVSTGTPDRDAHLRSGDHPGSPPPPAPGPSTPPTPRWASWPATSW